MTASYKQFCPVAMASEVLCNRWTMLLLRELIGGPARFNELRRGVARMSPALLSKRLTELEAANVVERIETPREPGVERYQLTEAGRDLKPVILAVGTWGQRWIEAAPSLENLDPGLLMWDMRRNLDPSPLPERRSVILFQYPDLPDPVRRWWLIVEPGAERPVDLCSVDPGFDVNLYATCALRCMTAIWMGLTMVKAEVAAAALDLIGDWGLADDMQIWLGLSPFAGERKLV